MSNWLEWLGYLASLIVLVSLLMSSIIKLRWINLLGSSMFSLYGFLIGALPVGFMNLGIAIVNIYFLVKIYSSKEFFKILPVEKNSLYYKNFYEFYSDEISKFVKTPVDIDSCDVSFYILRNMVHAGLFIGSRLNENTLRIDLDYVIPEYRDFKIGTYIFDQNKKYFIDKGYNNFVCFSNDPQHVKYLEKMGFTSSSFNGKSCHIKTI